MTVLSITYYESKIVGNNVKKWLHPTERVFILFIYLLIK